MFFDLVFQAIQPEVAEKLDNFIEKLKELLLVKKPFVMVTLCAGCYNTLINLLRRPAKNDMVFQIVICSEIKLHGFESVRYTLFNLK